MMIHVSLLQFASVIAQQFVSSSFIVADSIILTELTMKEGERNHQCYVWNVNIGTLLCYRSRMKSTPRVADSCFHVKHLFILVCSSMGSCWYRIIFKNVVWRTEYIHQWLIVVTDEGSVEKGMKLVLYPVFWCSLLIVCYYVLLFLWTTGLQYWHFI